MSAAYPNPASIAQHAGTTTPAAWRPSARETAARSAILPAGGGPCEGRERDRTQGEGASSPTASSHPQTHQGANPGNHSPRAASFSGITDADLALLHALDNPATLASLDPVALAAWRKRPEIQQALATRDWIKSLKDEAHNRRLREELEADNRLAREKLKRTIATAEQVLDALGDPPCDPPCHGSEIRRGEPAPSGDSPTPSSDASKPVGVSSNSSDDADTPQRLKALSELRRAATSLGRLSSLRSGPVAALFARATAWPHYRASPSTTPPAAQPCAPCPTCGARSRRSTRSSSSSSASAPSAPSAENSSRQQPTANSQEPDLPVYNFPPCPPGFPERPPPAARPEPAPETEAETEAAAIATVERILDALKHNDDPVPDTGISTAMAFHRWGDPHPPYPWHVFLPDFRGLLSPALVGHTSRSLRVLCYDRTSCMIDCRIRVDLEHADGRRAAVTFLMHLPRHTPPGGRKWEYDTIVLIPDPNKRYDTS